MDVLVVLSLYLLANLLALLACYALYWRCWHVGLLARRPDRGGVLLNFFVFGALILLLVLCTNVVGGTTSHRVRRERMRF